MQNVNNMSELEELVKWCKIRGAMLNGKSPFDVLGKVSENVTVGDQVFPVVCVITEDDINSIIQESSW